MSKFNIILLFLFISCSSSAPEKCIEIQSLLAKITKLKESAIAYPAKLDSIALIEDRLKTCDGHFDSTHALILRRIGDIYSIGGDFEKAIELYQRSIAIIEAHVSDPSVKPKDLITAYYKISSFNLSMNKIGERMVAYDSCVQIAIRLKSIDEYSLYSLYKLTEYAFHTADYHKCMEYAKLGTFHALELAEKGDADQKATGIYYAKVSVEWQVNCLLVLRRLDEAYNLLQTKVTEFSNMAKPGDLGFIYGMVGDVLLFGGNHEKALSFYNKSFELMKSDSMHGFNCKSTLNLIGYEIYFKKLNDREKALQYLDSAINYVVTDPKSQEESLLESLSIYCRIGHLLITEGKSDAALVYFQKAFDQIKPGISESTLLQSSYDEVLGGKRKGFIVTLIFYKAEAYRQKYKVTQDLNDLSRAVEIYKIADRFLENVKSNQSEAKSKLFWLNDRRKVYESAIDACYFSGNMNDAFYFFEKTRAALLYDQLNQQRLLSDADLMRQGLLRKDVLKLEKKLASLMSDTIERAQIQRQLVVAKKELDKIDNKFKIKNTYQQAYLEVDRDLLTTVQKRLLIDKKQLIEFFDGDSAVYMLTITPSKLFLQKFDRTVFNKTVNEYLKYLSNRQLMNRDFKGFAKASGDLYALIFEKWLPEPGKIIISPDSRYFPVEALLTNAIGEKHKYFIESHPISYSHSAKLLVGQADSTKNASRNFLGIAPVNFNPSLKLVSLKGSDESLGRLRKGISNGKSRTFRRATMENFLKDFNEFKVLQLYTHASAGKEGGEPEIYFSDSILHLSDLISDKRPATRLVVLSACETGAGKWYGGEGVFSFNRGFAAIGIPSSITNLWSVENKSTYRLTEIFYKHMATGEDIDVALQKAKLEFMHTGNKEEQLPYYWAAAILAGKTDPIYFDNSFSWDSIFWIIATTVLGLMLLAIWLNYKGSRATIKDRRTPDYIFS